MKISADLVLITDPVDELLIEGLRVRGAIVDYLPAISRDDVIDRIDGYQGIILNTKVPADGSLLDAGTSLRWVARLGSGREILDLPQLAERGIAVMTSPEGNRRAVAEHIISMVAALYRQLRTGQKAILDQPWPREAHRGIEWQGRTLGIIGYGQTGPMLVQLVRHWGLDIRVYDPYRGRIAGEGCYLRRCGMEELCRDSDIISLQVSLNEDTRQLVDRDWLSRCKPGAILVNSSRGAVVHAEAVLWALDAGILGGACLDVLDGERPEHWGTAQRDINQRLTEHPRVVITPHIAGWTHRAKKDMALSILKKLDAIDPGGRAIGLYPL